MTWDSYIFFVHLLINILLCVDTFFVSKVKELIVLVKNRIYDLLFRLLKEKMKQLNLLKGPFIVVNTLS